MSVIEQLTAWASGHERQIFVGVSVGDQPYVVTRIDARPIPDAFRKMSGASVARVEALKGVTCVVIDGHVPNASQTSYRAILSATEPFS